MATDRLKKLTPIDLRAKLRTLGVDVDNITKKVDLLVAAEENGIDDETLNREFPEAPAESVEDVEVVEVTPVPVATTAEPVEESPKVLLRMTRANPRFDTFGVKFTKETPFALVDEETAQNIIDAWDGFRIATPREAKEFYS